MRIPEESLGVPHLVVIPAPDLVSGRAFDLGRVVLNPSSEVLVCSDALHADAVAIPFRGEIPEDALPESGVRIDLTSRTLSFS